MTPLAQTGGGGFDITPWLPFAAAMVSLIVALIQALNQRAERKAAKNSPLNKVIDANIDANSATTEILKSTLGTMSASMTSLVGQQATTAAMVTDIYALLAKRTENAKKTSRKV